MPGDGSKFVVEQGDDARTVPVRLLVVQGEERPPVDVSSEPMVMTFPHLLVREGIAFLALSIVLVGISLLFDAPLEGLASPEKTPNPAKAPWYFLGLQELLHYYPPFVAGVLLPSILLISLAVIPYFKINLERRDMWDEQASGRFLSLGITWLAVVALSALFYFGATHPVWPIIGPLLLVGCLMSVGGLFSGPGRVLRWFRTRSVPFWIFLWFLLSAIALTMIGIFFRGPGWAFTLPWRDGVFY